MTILLLEDQGIGLNKKEMLDLLSKNGSSHKIPENLRKAYGNFGYKYTLSRSFDEVIEILIKNRWAQKNHNKKYSLSSEGLKELKSMVTGVEENHLHIAAYGKINKSELLKII